MALTNVYVEKAIKEVTGDAPIENAIDTITKDAPIMAFMPMEAANGRFVDTFEVLKSVDGIEQTDLDAPIPEIDLATDIEQLSLNAFSGRIVAGIDKLNLLGVDMAQYASDRLPKHYRRTMEQMEKTWIYNFARAYAIANYAEDNTRVIDFGSANNTNYSIIAVRWETGETTGLFDAQGFGNGKIFEEIFESGGNAYRDANDRTVQSMVVKNYVGFKFANPLHVAAIVNIDVAAVPTEDQLGQLIDDTNADALYMHPTLARKISNTYGVDRIQYDAGDTNLGQSFLTYDGIPMITSRQFERGTESNVTL